MKKILYLLIASALMLSLEGCTEDNNSSVTDDIQNDTSVSDTQKNEDNSQIYIINKNENKTVFSPNDSVSFEKACELIDKCSMSELEIPQSAENFRKYYFGTVNYYNKSYYSVYLYTEKDDKKVFVGNNILVSCDGTYALVKNLFGQYDKLTENGSETDSDYQELYPDAKTSPVEALKNLADKNLQLDYSLTQLIFNVNRELSEIQGINCYEITPSVEFTNSITMLPKLYITADGSGRVLKYDNSEDDYIELK